MSCCSRKVWAAEHRDRLLEQRRRCCGRVAKPEFLGAMVARREAEMVHKSYDGLCSCAD